MPGINALLLGSLLYQSRLVPRIIPVLGLIGAPILIAAVIATLLSGSVRPLRGRARRTPGGCLGAVARHLASRQRLQTLPHHSRNDRSQHPARLPRRPRLTLETPPRPRSPKPASTQVAHYLDKALVLALDLVWLAHIGTDRLLGYGLKHDDTSNALPLALGPPRYHRETSADRAPVASRHGPARPSQRYGPVSRQAGKIAKRGGRVPKRADQDGQGSRRRSAAIAEPSRVCSVRRPPWRTYRPP